MPVKRSFNKNKKSSSRPKLSYSKRKNTGKTKVVKQVDYRGVAQQVRSYLPEEDPRTHREIVRDCLVNHGNINTYLAPMEAYVQFALEEGIPL